MDYDDDVVWGAPAIADLTGLPVSKCYYRLERGDLPGVKIGSSWAMRKSAWRALLEERERNAMARARSEEAA